MPKWMTRFLESIRNLPSRTSPRWPWPLRKVRKADIPDTERDLFERYGETVISMQVRGSFVEDAEHARAWLTERADYQERRERITLLLEIVVVLLILGEIVLALRQEHLQSLNFKEQQQGLTTLQQSSQTTADNLTSLHTAIESTNTILQMQLDALKKSAAETARTAKAGEASASTASQALHVSERAYVYMTPSLRKPPSSGEKIQISIIVGNAGRTSALELEVHYAVAFVPSSMPLNEALASAVAAPSQTPASVTVLQSGQTTEAPSESPRELDQSALEQLTGGKMSLYVFGSTTYRDVFQQPHRTEICAVYVPKSNAFLNCHEHNKSD
jgi:hypothetical protein